MFYLYICLVIFVDKADKKNCYLIKGFEYLSYTCCNQMKYFDIKTYNKV